MTEAERFTQLLSDAGLAIVSKSRYDALERFHEACCEQDVDKLAVAVELLKTHGNAPVTP